MTDITAVHIFGWNGASHYEGNIISLAHRRGARVVHAENRKMDVHRCDLAGSGVRRNSRYGECCIRDEAQ